METYEFNLILTGFQGSLPGRGDSDQRKGSKMRPWQFH